MSNTQITDAQNSIHQVYEAYLENFHGRLAHSRPAGWRRYMDGEGVQGAVV